MNEQNTQPDPPRFRWLKRLTWGSVIFLVIVAGLRAYWGHVAGARLQAVVDVIEARGDPLHIEQIAPDPVDDEDNAAYYLLEATAAWPKINGEYVNAFDGEDPVTDNRKYLSDCQAAIALIEKAGQCGQCDWKVDTNRALINLPLDRFRTTRTLTRLLSDAATRRHNLGEHTQALVMFSHLLNVARTNAAPPCFLIHSLVAGSCVSNAFNEIERITATLGAKSGPSGHTTDPELHATAKALIRDLLDERPMTAGLHNAWRGERVYMYSVGSTITKGQVSIRAIGGWPPPPAPVLLEKSLVFAFRPQMMIDHARAIRNFEDVAPAVTTTDTYPSFLAAAPELNEEPQFNFDFSPQYLRPFSGLGMSSSYAMVEWHYRVLARTRMAATALAIRLYQLDHGRRPESLDQLVPAYLPAVPIDPFATDGRTIAYKPEGVVPAPGDDWITPKQLKAAFGDRRFAVLYSVGIDGKDDGGRLKGRKDRELYWREPLDRGDDLGFILDERPPLIETFLDDDDFEDWDEEFYEDSLEQAPDGDGDVPDDEWDDDEDQPGQ